jgi:hypothetical protein
MSGQQTHRRVTFQCGCALLVISILLVVPALTRALQHSLTLSPTGFRFSKNFERPPDKFKSAPTSVELSVSEAFDLGVSPVACFHSSGVVVRPACIIVDERPVRAPPSHRRRA